MGLITGTSNTYYNSVNAESLHGNYQFVNLNTIINQFLISYVGHGKIISKINRLDVAYHAQRAVQELSFDTLPSTRGIELTVPPSLKLPLPQDYVNYTQISWIDSLGSKRRLYPTKNTSNPKNPYQNSDGDLKITATGTLTAGSIIIPLDGEYLNIAPGMRVIGEGIDGVGQVESVSTTNGITTITKNGTSGVSDNVIHTGNRTLTFYRQDSQMILNDEAVVLQDISWSIATNEQTILTVGSSGDASQVKIGWAAHHDDFPNNTTVKDVQGDKIIISNNVNSSVAVSGASVTFVSNENTSESWKKYKSAITTDNDNYSYDNETYWSLDGTRYGLDPQHAQVNGTFYIDQIAGKIHFSSNVSGKIVVIDYISDGVGEDNVTVHKFAEEAIYKYIAHAILATRANTPEFLVARFKKEKFAEIRKAKLRLSNIKIEEITQILRGKSKQIKH